MNNQTYKQQVAQSAVQFFAKRYKFITDPSGRSAPIDCHQCTTDMAVSLVQLAPFPIKSALAQRATR